MLNGRLEFQGVPVVVLIHTDDALDYLPVVRGLRQLDVLKVLNVTYLPLLVVGQVGLPELLEELVVFLGSKVFVVGVKALEEVREVTHVLQNTVDLITIHLILLSIPHPSKHSEEQIVVVLPLLELFWNFLFVFVPSKIDFAEGALL